VVLSRRDNRPIKNKQNPWHNFRTALFMKLDEFIRLGLGDKADLLWREGVYLENHCEKNQTVNLYYIFNFYVEVIVSHSTYRIREIKAFMNGTRLDKYLQKINLNELSAEAEG
jgi:hypothetical protein